MILFMMSGGSQTHNSRSCKARKEQLVAKVEEAVDREVENHQGETMDAACKMNLTQGCPQSQVEPEVRATSQVLELYTLAIF